jgi:hypothetical protein
MFHIEASIQKCNPKTLITFVTQTSGLTNKPLIYVFICCTLRKIINETGQNNEQNRTKGKEERQKETGDTKTEGGQGDGNQTYPLYFISVQIFYAVGDMVINPCVRGPHGTLLKRTLKWSVLPIKSVDF